MSEVKKNVRFTLEKAQRYHVPWVVGEFPTGPQRSTRPAWPEALALVLAQHQPLPLCLQDLWIFLLTLGKGNSPHFSFYWS